MWRRKRSEAFFTSAMAACVLEVISMIPVLQVNSPYHQKMYAQVPSTIRQASGPEKTEKLQCLKDRRYNVWPRSFPTSIKLQSLNLVIKLKSWTRPVRKKKRPNFLELNRKMTPRPGIEPGWHAWQAGIVATILPRIANIDQNSTLPIPCCLVLRQQVYKPPDDNLKEKKKAEQVHMKHTYSKRRYWVFKTTVLSFSKQRYWIL